MNQIGDVILTARRAAGLTQEELAERLGITQAALSRYENNLREPDDAAVERMSEILDLSPDFLTHPFQLRGAIAADAHMRRQKTTKVTEWKSAESKLNLYRMRSAFLTRRIPLNPTNHMPTFDPDETTPADAARMVRAQWRMPIGPVRNLTRWIESAGVIVIEERLGTRRIDGLSQWASEYPVVLLNADLPADRKRWTLAHEVGHLVLHSNYIDPDVERQANEFAAELLMPSHIIEPDLHNLTPSRLLALKKMWGVSMQAIFEHAHHLGKASAADRTKFYRTMNARGWRRHEPGTDVIADEQPELAQTIGQTLMIRGGLSRDEVARLTGCRSAGNESPFLPPETHLRVV
ncbi:helix-turn-helix domain-containing protein [[Mycobacterium] vasticus]|uniref:XRE family transcriptional regulator n=1 Tax=[Mycobacterium] vasticus TaxID=2875777 RepID=A0ABU5Z3U1_9MYCO|nr:XRE family transcriptional regulator [Mycolicibacter sp. MYC017]MEB3072068.1 XRE family transcriptional regulator [Mycolicibacter sp. MYC017]